MASSPSAVRWSALTRRGRRAAIQTRARFSASARMLPCSRTCAAGLAGALPVPTGVVPVSRAATGSRFVGRAVREADTAAAAAPSVVLVPAFAVITVASMELSPFVPPRGGMPPRPVSHATARPSGRYPAATTSQGVGATGRAVADYKGVRGRAGNRLIEEALASPELDATQEADSTQRNKWKSDGTVGRWRAGTPAGDRTLVRRAYRAFLGALQRSASSARAATRGFCATATLAPAAPRPAAAAPPRVPS